MQSRATPEYVLLYYSLFKLDEECAPVSSASSASSAPPPRSRLRLPHALRALRHRNYRLLFFGQLIAHIASGCRRLRKDGLCCA